MNDKEVKYNEKTNLIESHYNVLPHGGHFIYLYVLKKIDIEFNLYIIYIINGINDDRIDNKHVKKRCGQRQDRYALCLFK